MSVLLFILKLCFLLILVECYVLPRSKSQDRVAHFKTIIAFGDSYTDNESLAGLYADPKSKIDESSLHPQTTKLIRRASNGPLWIEYLSMDMNDAALYDFARSGAAVNNTLTPRLTQDINSQVKYYLNSTISISKNDSIYFLWSGVNDINDIFIKYKTDSQARRNILDGVIKSITFGMDQLYNIAGAKYVMLLGLIPLEELPLYHNVTQEIRTELKYLVDDYNFRLANIISTGHSSAYFFDIYKLFKESFSKERLQFNSEFYCHSAIQCGDYIWWDKLHPTTYTHSLIAKAIHDTLLQFGW
ncbi:GDSL lipase/esterase [Cokeromyces recurvatus]|uniref:GDSL lipase/esterase n=1 Tax=Cokeromyces recurvatus TaxID=90255 RepID=UPI0022212563|nr:GDSL lipase/esterase [Cokeromyces recurvatus]KAI7905760.1 GDSL lipase/esterase [Cokeromyces recurvatus]